MGKIILLVLWLALNFWATRLVMDRGPVEPTGRVLLYALIWLVPFIGAGIAGFAVGASGTEPEAALDEKMFNEVLEGRSSENDSQK